MDWLTDEILFYGGAAAAVSSLVLAIVYLIVSHIHRSHLDLQLEKEYGNVSK